MLLPQSFCPADQRQLGTQVKLVEPRRVVAEDRALDRAIGGPERRKPVLLDHVQQRVGGTPVILSYGTPSWVAFLQSEAVIKYAAWRLISWDDRRIRARLPARAGRSQWSAGCH
jgi:hypothetical protein